MGIDGGSNKNIHHKKLSRVEPTATDEPASKRLRTDPSTDTRAGADMSTGAGLGMGVGVVGVA